MHGPVVEPGGEAVLADIQGVHGDLAAALEESVAAGAAAERAGSALFLYMIFSLRAWAQSRSGLHAEAEESLQRCHEAGQRLGSRLLIGDWVAAIRAELALNRGDNTAARALGGGALAVAQASRGLYARGLAQRVIAQALLNDDRLEEAESALRSSHEAFALGGAVVALGETDALLARLRELRARA